jgi:uncharacterized protein YggE
MTKIWNLLALSLFSFSAVLGQFDSDQNKDNTLVVEGTAIIKEIPKDIFAVIKIKAESQSYSACQEKLLYRSDIIKSSMIKEKINKDLIKTESIAIDEKSDYVNGKRERNGFEGSISLSIQTQFSPDLASRLLTSLKIDSLDVAYSIKFKLSEDQKSRMRQETITLASNDAREKAMIIAKSMNIKLGEINSISYLNEGSMFDADKDIVIEEINLNNYMDPIGDDSQHIDFNPKEIGIYKSIKVEFKIRRNKN